MPRALRYSWGGGGGSYERGTPVPLHPPRKALGSKNEHMITPEGRPTRDLCKCDLAFPLVEAPEVPLGYASSYDMACMVVM